MSSRPFYYFRVGADFLRRKLFPAFSLRKCWKKHSVYRKKWTEYFGFLQLSRLLDPQHRHKTVLRICPNYSLGLGLRKYLISWGHRVKLCLEWERARQYYGAQHWLGLVTGWLGRLFLVKKNICRSKKDTQASGHWCMSPTRKALSWA